MIAGKPNARDIQMRMPQMMHGCHQCQYEEIMRCRVGGGGGGGAATMAGICPITCGIY